MNVLVVGSGGREHALCWSIAASPLCDRLYCAPGNAGIADHATCIAIDPMNFDGLIDFARARQIGLVVVGPEAPLVAGLVDRLEAAGIAAFGPTAKAAILEGSKAFTKDLCRRHGIATPDHASFAASAADQARAYVRARGAPIVVKADGLAAGKGVTVAANVEQALAAIDSIAAGDFGEAGRQIVIEQFVAGEEASVFALVDGDFCLALASAQDHKAVGEGDTGPNTGGMGAYSPAPVVTPAIARQVMDQIIRPTVKAMAAEGRPFNGVLYAGLMLTAAGPKLLEYNVRFGDPECQVLLPRLMSDLLPALIAARDGELGHFDLRWHDRTALCVVLASKGYPGNYLKGSEIRGFDAVAGQPDVILFHAGTARQNGRLIATGGRVLNVVGLGDDVSQARDRAYAAIDRIDWPEGFCRRDIGWRALKR